MSIPIRLSCTSVVRTTLLFQTESYLGSIYSSVPHNCSYNNFLNLACHYYIGLNKFPALFPPTVKKHDATTIMPYSFPCTGFILFFQGKCQAFGFLHNRKTTVLKKVFWKLCPRLLDLRTYEGRVL